MKLRWRQAEQCAWPQRARASFCNITAKPTFDVVVKRPSMRICVPRCAACCQLLMNVRCDFCLCRSSGEWAPLQ